MQVQPGDGLALGGVDDAGARGLDATAGIVEIVGLHQDHVATVAAAALQEAAGGGARGG
ncbi:MAG: hypothetical protein R2755_01930 [Acidimicrobiales bacterium]